MRFHNRTAIVTGGTGALGTTVVGALLAEGAHCLVPYRRDADADTFPYKDRVTLVSRCDLTNEADVSRLYGGVTDLWASIHLAGGFAIGDLSDTDKNSLMQMLNMNFVSCYLCCRAALGVFGPSGGRIVNVASRPALEPRGGSGSTAYTASKSAVAALTQALAAEVAGRNIVVNAIAPSIIDTPANRAAMPKADYAAWPTTQEISAAITSLASPENKVISGAVVPVYGRA
jgi:NAD(P)-dependent dehydrogenase (short-subunit alcohol dehydrogenase family)